MKNIPKKLVLSLGVVIAGLFLLGPLVAVIYPTSTAESKPARAAAQNSSPIDPPSSAQIKTASDFLHSEFCQRYRCEETDHWSLQTGGVNHSYETTLKHVSVETQSATSSDDSNVTGFDLMFSERDRLSDEDFRVIAALVRSADQNVNQDRAISFVRENVEDAVCSTCHVDQSAKSMKDGDFRIWAGKSGMDQVVVFKRAAPGEEADYLQRHQ